MSQQQQDEIYTVYFSDFTSKNIKATNAIRTTKYTIISFLPLNLMSQFRRFYNLYFLFGTILSFSLPAASPMDPSLLLTPLVVVVTITAAKDIFEDYLRFFSFSLSLSLSFSQKKNLYSFIHSFIHSINFKIHC